MPGRRILPISVIVAVVAGLFAAIPTTAQEEELSVSIDPERGIHGTTVTISGSGAPADTELIVSVAPWDQDQQCDTPRDGDTIDTVTTDQNGEFSATHTAEQLAEDHVGNTYFAYIPSPDAEQQRSNLACFEFGVDHSADFVVDIEPEAGTPGSTVTINGSGVPANAEVQVSYAVWTEIGNCRGPRDASSVATVTADEDGEFSATHTAEQFGDDHVGNTYFAYLPVQETPQPQSNLECFAFDGSNEARHFDQTGHWVTDRFLEFWENNGQLSVFGYPLNEDVVEDGRTTQYFERQRFELHRENERPFDVLLGHLGRQAAEERGLLDHEAFHPVDGAGNNEECRYFEATGHRVCHGFLDYWSSVGLDLGDDGVSIRESIMLFGYPISEEFTDPDTGMTVQYFERAKLEYHPDNDPPWDVIPERLGDNLFDQ